MTEDGPCYYCGERTNSLHGNPGLWPVLLPHISDPGKMKPHHMRCVLERLSERDALVEAAKKAMLSLRTESRDEQGRRVSSYGDRLTPELIALGDLLWLKPKQTTPLSEADLQWLRRKACDHGLSFDVEEAKRILGDWTPVTAVDFISGNPKHVDVRRRFPRLEGPCPKGCGFSGIAYVSTEHFTYGDW